jgi:hypothetical protein
VVHHGGTGTALGALGAGRPQLLLPQGADQFVNAELIPAVGGGPGVAQRGSGPGTIAELVVAMLGDSPEAATARRISAEIATMPAPDEVAADLVGLVGYNYILVQASLSTCRSTCSISSNSACPQISGGATWTTGSPRSSARQYSPFSNSAPDT